MDSTPIFLFALSAITAFGTGLYLKHTYAISRRWSQAKGDEGESYASQLLDDVGCYDRLEGLVIGDGALETMAEVDALVKAPACLINVETKNWSGLITPGEEFWEIEYANGNKVTRKSPLRQAHRQSSVIASHYPGVPVETLVLMVGRARFKDGYIPAGVCTKATLGHEVRKMFATEVTDLQKAAADYQWARIVDWAFDAKADERAETYKERLERKYGQRRWESWYRFALYTIGLGMVAVLLLEQAYLAGRSGVILPARSFLDLL